MALTQHQIILICLIVFLALIPIVSGILFIFWNRIVTSISKRFLGIKFPHKIICAEIHFPANKTEKIYRIIPDTEKLSIKDGAYHFSMSNLTKNKELHDKLVFHDSTKRLCFRYETDLKQLRKEAMTKDEYNKVMSKKEPIYYINEQMIIKDENDTRIPTIHYWYNNPNPINFDYSNETALITANDVKVLIEAEVVRRLLKLAEQNMLLMILIIIGAVNLIIGIVNMSKIMGWVK